MSIIELYNKIKAAFRAKRLVKSLKNGFIRGRELARINAKLRKWLKELASVAKTFTVYFSFLGVESTLQYRESFLSVLDSIIADRVKLLAIYV